MSHTNPHSLIKDYQVHNADKGKGKLTLAIVIIKYILEISSFHAEHKINIEIYLITKNQFQ